MFAQFMNRFFQSGFLQFETLNFFLVLFLLFSDLFKLRHRPFHQLSLLVLELLHRCCMGRMYFLHFHRQFWKFILSLTKVASCPFCCSCFIASLFEESSLERRWTSSWSFATSPFRATSFSSVRLNFLFVLRGICFCCCLAMSNLFHFAYLQRLGIELLTQGFHL